MNHKSKRVLAIETSCDETAAAIIEAVYPEQSRENTIQIKPLSSVVYSQIDLHKKFGGVYPELASREHIKKIRPIVEQAIAETQNPHLSLNDIDAIAVTTGPGLAGSLIVGVEFARGLAASFNLPVIPVNHLEGHIYANFADDDNRPQFPLVALIVSGGHTQLVLMRDHLDYKIIGTTVDDAAGECFDKIARMLGLPYPGGPALSKLAGNGDTKAFDFPRSMLQSGDYNFSFSGLKTSVFYKLRGLGLVDNNAEPILDSKIMNLESIKRDLAASAQAAIVDVLVTKTLRAARDYKIQSIIVGGGVAANQELRQRIIHESKILNLKSYLSPLELTGDNALSIAITAAYHLKNGDVVPWHDLDTNASLRLQ